MIVDGEYQLITKDIAGARTKNRFAYEVDYGISKIYDCYLSKSDDFFIIFDYACDIEVGHDDKIDFYQLKTKRNSKFNLKKLTNKDDILKTLINLKRSKCVDKLYLVSNVGFDEEIKDKSGKIVNLDTFETFNFDLLSAESKSVIDGAMKWPLGTKEYSSIIYVVSNLCLDNPNETLLGKTDEFLSTVYRTQPNKAKDFLAAIKAVVESKAIYERNTVTLAKTIEKKGLVKSDVDKILQEYFMNLVNSRLVGYDTISDFLIKNDYSTGLSQEIKKDYAIFFGQGYVQDFHQLIINDIKKLYSSPEYYSLSNKEAVAKIVKEYDFKEIMIDSHKYLMAIYAICI